MIRLFVPEGLSDGQQVWAIPADERHHLRVRRASGALPVELLDGQGHRGRGILSPDGDSVLVNEISTVPPPPLTHLLVGAGDRERFTWVVEKAVELGVTDITPLLSERAVGVATRVREEHRVKLERRAQEALKQSGNAWLARIHVPVAPAALDFGRLPEVRWIAAQSGRWPNVTDLRAGVAVCVGPEGGFTDPEIAYFETHGFIPVRLADATLRFETAAVAAATMVAYLRGEDS
jgi:16S rRNA (uracil1498-N3)-methyltransferase